MVVVTITLLWFTLRFLSILTLHGQSIDVPDFKGLHIKEIEEYADDNNLKCVIFDSIFDSR